jgi:hypothetical protein
MEQFGSPQRRKGRKGKTLKKENTSEKDYLLITKSQSFQRFLVDTSKK